MKSPRVARTLQEAEELIEAEFDYVANMDGVKLFRCMHLAIGKEFIDKKPHTMLHLTDKGRTAFQEYRQNMKQVFEDLPK